MFERKEKTIKEKSWQNMLHDKTIPSYQNLGTKRFKKKKKIRNKLPPFGKFVTEVLIFRSSRSQMFFKIGALKNFAIMELLFNKVGCFWIFVAVNTFFS